MDLSPRQNQLIALFFAATVLASMVAVPVAAGATSPAADGPDHADGQAALLQGASAQDAPDGSDDSGGPSARDGAAPDAAGPPGHDRVESDAAAAVPELRENSSVEAVAAAARHLDDLGIESEDERTSLNRSVAALDDLLDEYRRTDRFASGAAYDDARDAHAGLAELTAATNVSEGSPAAETSEGLYRATNRSTHLAVRDAAVAITRYEDAFSNPGKRQAAESALANAVDALERANETAAGGAGVDAVERHERATTHLAASWRHAERSLGVVENSTAPQLSASQRSAFEENGTVVVPVEVGLADVRPYAYDEVAVTVERGNATAEPVDLVAPEAAAATATGTTLVDLGEEPENVTLRLAATAEHDANRTTATTLDLVVDEDDVAWDLPDRSEYGTANVVDDESGAAVEVSGPGVWEGAISVSDETPNVTQSFRSGPVVRVTNATPVDEATVSLPIADGVEPSANLSIYRWDPATEAAWEPVETEIDAENRTAAGTVPGFSYFTVFHVDEWEEYRTERVRLRDRHVQEWVDPRAGGESPVQTPGEPGETLWTWDDYFLTTSSSPSVVDGRVYTSTINSTVYALDAATGETQWSTEAGWGGMTADVAVDNDTVFTAHRSLSAFDADTGDRNWQYEDGVGPNHGSVAVGDGTVFAPGPSDGWSVDAIHAVDVETGEAEWTYQRDDASFAGAAPVLADGRLYLNDEGNDALYGLDADTGQEAWTLPLDSSLWAAPTVWEGTVYVSGGLDDTWGLHAVDAATGEVEWSYDAGYPLYEPTVADGTVYAGAQEDQLIALDATTGDEVWTSDAPEGSILTPPTVAGGVVYAGSSSDAVYAIDAATGSELWSEPALDTHFATAPTVSGGVLFVTEWGSGVHAIQTSTTDSSEDSRARLGTFGHLGTYEERGLAPDAVPVRGSEQAVVLADSSGDGIPDVAAEANPVIPELVPLLGEDEARADIDPDLADSSGDGLPDADAVDLEYHAYVEDDEPYLEVRVASARHHPNRIDTTGDGLSDREQLEGWEIEVVEEHAHARAMMASLRDPDRDLDPAQFFQSRTVESNPLLEDTNGDGLSDVKENDLGTDPQARDTTGDGWSDQQALDNPDEDPTIFTTSGPDVTLYAYHEWTDPGGVSASVGWDGVDVDAEAPSWNFQYRFRLYDPAGITSYEIDRGRYRVGSETLPHEPRSHVAQEELHSLREGVFSSWRGSQATVTATDVHGNQGAERIHSTSSFYGGVIGTSVDPYSGGVLSGFTHSAAELPELIAIIGEALWDDPRQAGTDFVELIDSIDSDDLGGVVDMMVEATREQQRLDNPHPEDTDEHDAYAQGWYEGYVLHFLASMAYGGAVTKGASEGANVGTRLSRVRDDLPTTARIATDGSGTASARIGSRLADKGYDQLARQFQTAGKQAQALKKLDAVDTRVLRQLDDAQRTELLQHLTKHPNGVRLVDDLGPQRVDDLFSLSVRRTDTAQLRENLFRLHRGGVTSNEIDAFVRNVDELQGTTGLHRTLDDVTKNSANRGNFRGATGEVEHAARLKRNGNDILEMQRPTSVSRPGDVDVTYRTPDGNVVGAEIKNRRAAHWPLDEFKSDVGAIDAGFRIASGLDSHEIVFKRSLPDEYRNWLQKNDIPHRIDT